MTTMQDAAVFWQSVLEQIEDKLTAGQFKTWFSRTRCLELKKEGVRVGAENAFTQEWLENTYTELVFECARNIRPGFKGNVVFEVDPEAAPRTSAARDAELPMPAQLNRPTEKAHDTLSPAAGDPFRPSGFGNSLVLNQDYTFENFVVGPSNRLSHAAALAVVEGLGRVYNPLFIHGGLGLGKTHLLQAICHELAARRGGGLRMLYLPCEQFINQFILALEKGGINAFRDRYRALDVLVIDDIHFLANKDHSQEEFFHTFNALYNDHKQIILSSDSPPRDIPMLEDRLVSRFKWGLVCEIEQPTYETRLAIIRKKGQGADLDVPDEVADHLASSMGSSSIREIEGAVTRLIGYATIMDCPINLKNAKLALGDLIAGSKKRVSIDQIIEMVCEHYGVRLADLQSKKRTQSIAGPRQICMYLIRKCTDHSLNEIGGYFGGRDHSTVLYATEKVRKRTETDPDYRSTIDEFTRRTSAEDGGE